MIYADYNATTPLGTGALREMKLAFDCWGNPSSSHHAGRNALELIEKARECVAETILARPQDLVFTSGGSEANTLALLGSFWSVHPTKGSFKLLTSKVEHSSIRDTVSLLEKLGAEVAYVEIDKNGQLDLKEFETQLQSFKPDLVSLMVVNNETGVLLPIEKIAGLCKQFNTILHSDAVPAFGKISPEILKDVPLISISAHKIFGPKGVGALIVKNGIKLVATHYGGSQEIKRRGGTQNIIGIAGFGGACTDLKTAHPLENLNELRLSFEKQILSALDGVSINGSASPRISNTSNFRFQGIPSEVLLGALDLEGICVSAGSACSSGSISPSHVLLNMGFSADEAKECVRFSWSHLSTLDETKQVAERVIFHVNRIRERKKTK